MVLHKHLFSLGIVGLSGAGKTTFAKAILDGLGAGNVAYIPYDSYYCDLSHLPMEERIRSNFDCPEAFETDLLIQHLELLMNNHPVDIPMYDFATHTRRHRVRRVPPCPIILAEGLLPFSNTRLRELFNLRIFLEGSLDLCLLRRLQRDVTDRGRSIQSVINQWEQSVHPMYWEFIEPIKHHAHIIVSEGSEAQGIALDMLLLQLEDLLRTQLQTA